MSTKQTTKDLTPQHNQVIDKWQANERASAKDAWSALESTIKLMVEWFNLVASVLFKVAGLSAEDRTTMTGGSFHGHVTGKKDHPLRYAGDREYVSQAYCTRAFLIHYLHRPARFAEYRNTNTRAVLKDYVTWLQVMYGDSTGEHAALSRKPEATIARFVTTKATQQDKAAGRKFATAVYRDEVRDNDGDNAPKGVNATIREVVAMTPAKRRSIAAQYDMSEWSNASILESIKAAIAQLMLNEAAAKKEKAATKSKVKA